MKTLCLALVCGAALSVSCLAGKTTTKRSGIEFRAYADGGAFPETYREDFAATLKKYPRGRFARAYRGDRTALRRYFAGAQVAIEEGDDNRSMSYVLLKLLLGSRDYRFSRALETEDFATRRAVGRLLNPLLEQHRLGYPLTRSTFRPRPRSRTQPRPVIPRD